MQPADVLSRPARSPDLTLTYGRPDLVADLFLPPADRARAAAPLIVFLHGGFWRAAYDRKHAGPLAEALAAAGFAVCLPEYRRVGQDGGGWPGTFDDVRAAVARLPGLVGGAAGGPGRTRLGSIAVGLLTRLEEGTWHCGRPASPRPRPSELSSVWPGSVISPRATGTGWASAPPTA